MAKPKRTFSADEGQYSKGTAGPDQLEYDLDNFAAMFDPNALLKDGSQGGIGVDNLKADAVVDQSFSPTSNTGRLDTLIGRIANRIRAILGGTTPDWKNDPAITLVATKAHVDDTTIHTRDVASVDGVSNPGGNVDLVAGVGIAITPNNTAKTITIDATGTASPAAHASTHASGGSDPVSPASIGAETPAGAQSKVDTHAANASAHHTRYTDAEAVAAIKAADGTGSGLDADYLRGLVPGTGPNNVLQLDANGKVLSGNLPFSITLVTSGSVSVPSDAFVDVLVAENGDYGPFIFKATPPLEGTQNGGVFTIGENACIVYYGPLRQTFLRLGPCSPFGGTVYYWVWKINL